MKLCQPGVVVTVAARARVEGGPSVQAVREYGPATELLRLAGFTESVNEWGYGQFTHSGEHESVRRAGFVLHLVNKAET